MRTLIHLISLAIIIILLCSTSLAESDKFINGVARIEGCIKGNDLVKIIIGTTKYSPNYPYQDGFMWGADEYEKPRFLISNIKILIGNRKVFVPLSAYCDLANPNNVVLKTNQNSFNLIIYGGDAGSSYMAELLFENSHIKYRKISHGEFPDEVWEKTEYHFNTLDN